MALLWRGLSFSSARRTMASTAVSTVQRVTAKLTHALSPIHIAVLNESHMHNVPAGSETHLRVIVISEKFDNQAIIERHRMVNTVVDEELRLGAAGGGLHALAIVAKSKAQWDAMSQEQKDQILQESSPKCRGGFGK